MKLPRLRSCDILSNSETLVGSMFPISCPSPQRMEKESIEEIRSSIQQALIHTSYLPRMTLFNFSDTKKMQTFLRPSAVSEDEPQMNEYKRKYVMLLSKGCIYIHTRKRNTVIWSEPRAFWKMRSRLDLCKLEV